jgi:hypothetical protein
MATIPDRIRQRFFDNITINNCWIWTGTTDKVGLPNLKTKKEYSARRLSLIFAGKDLSVHRLHVIVKCGNRLCVNPDHLAIGDEARFLSHVNKTENCWFWTGGTDKNGYGKFSIKHGDLKKDIRAHRFSYELDHGPIESSSVCVCHTCDNPPCVNPNHLFLGSNFENTLDRTVKGRSFHPIGTLNTQAKLDDIKVKQIIDLYQTGKYSMQDIATTYDCSPANIGDIVRGNSWKHIPRPSHKDILIEIAKTIPKPEGT